MTENPKPYTPTVPDLDQPMLIGVTRHGRGRVVTDMSIADALRVGQAYQDYRKAAPKTPDNEAIAFAQTALPRYYPEDRPYAMALSKAPLSPSNQERAETYLIGPNLAQARKDWPDLKLFWMLPLTYPAKICRGALWILNADGTRSIAWPKGEPEWPESNFAMGPHEDETHEGAAPQPFVIIDGGAVQNTPSIPVIDYDEIRAMDVPALHKELARISEIAQQEHNRPHQAELHKSYQYVRELIDDRMGLDSADRG